VEEFGELIRERVMPNHERFRSKICADDDRYIEVGALCILCSCKLPCSCRLTLVSWFNIYYCHVFRSSAKTWITLFRARHIQQFIMLSSFLIYTTGPIGFSGCIRKELAAQLAPTRDRETLALFRVHHALCDGVSLSVAVGDLCDEADDLDAAVAQLAKDRKERAKKRSVIQTFFHLLNVIMCYTFGTVVALTLQTWRTLVCYSNSCLSCPLPSSHGGKR
jgi:hypothetical protein